MRHNQVTDIFGEHYRDEPFRSVPVTSNPESRLPCAHYSDNRFREAQLVFKKAGSTGKEKLAWDG